MTYRCSHIGCDKEATVNLMVSISYEVLIMGSAMNPKLEANYCGKHAIEKFNEFMSRDERSTR